MLVPLRQRDFLLLWTGGLISLAGDWMLIVALPLHVYALTISTAATGFAVAMETSPRVLVGSVAGVFVDRWDRRRTMVIVNLLLAAALSVLVVPGATGRLDVIYGVSPVAATLAQFVAPAEHALLPRLVYERHLLAANALDALNGNLAHLLGPPLGGLAAAAWSLRGIGVIDSALFLLAAALIWAIADRRSLSVVETPPSPARKSGPWRTMWREWRAGWGVVRRERAVAVVFGVIAVTSLGEGVFSVLLVIWVVQVLGGGTAEFGWLLAAQAAGGLIGVALTTIAARALPLPWLLGASGAAFGLIDLVIVNYPLLIPGIAPGLVIFALVGIPGVWFMTTLTTLLQRSVSDDLRGRVFGSLGTTGALMTVLGTLLASLLGNSWGVIAVLNVQGTGYIAAGLAALFVLRRLMRPPYSDAAGAA